MGVWRSWLPRERCSALAIDCHSSQSVVRRRPRRVDVAVGSLASPAKRTTSRHFKPPADQPSPQSKWSRHRCTTAAGAPEDPETWRSPSLTTTTTSRTPSTTTNPWPTGRDTYPSTSTQNSRSSPDKRSASTFNTSSKTNSATRRASPCSKRYFPAPDRRSTPTGSSLDRPWATCLREFIKVRTRNNHRAVLLLKRNRLKHTTIRDSANKEDPYHCLQRLFQRQRLSQQVPLMRQTEQGVVSYPQELLLT